MVNCIKSLGHVTLLLNIETLEAWTRIKFVVKCRQNTAICKNDSDLFDITERVLDKVRLISAGKFRRRKTSARK